MKKRINYYGEWEILQETLSDGSHVYAVINRIKNIKLDVINRVHANIISDALFNGVK